MHFARRFAIHAIALVVVALLSISQSWACSSLTGISPSSGPASGGTVVTITGTGLSCTISVTFGGVAAKSFTVVNDSTITAVTPAGSGTVDVVVNVNGTSHTLSAAFTYTTSSSDSQNLQTLQVNVSHSVAGTSGQVISGAVNDGIGDAFSGGGGPITPGPNGFAVNFAAVPKTAEEASPAYRALAYAASIDKAPRAPLIREWSAWADLRATGFDHDDASTHGHQLNLTAGIGRKLTPDLLVGIFSGYEGFDFTLSSIAGKTTGHGGTVGGYAAWRFASRWRVDGMLGWSRLSYDNSSGNASGSFSGNRWLLSAGLTGDYRAAPLLIEPSAHIYALWERDGDWTDSLGTVQAARTFSVGRVSLGGKASDPWHLASGLKIAPYAGLYCDYRFSSDSALPVGASNTGISDGTTARVTAGIAASNSAGLALALGGELGGLGAGYRIWSVNARIALRE